MLELTVKAYRMERSVKSYRVEPTGWSPQGGTCMVEYAKWAL